MAEENQIQGLQQESEYTYGQEESLVILSKAVISKAQYGCERDFETRSQ